MSSDGIGASDESGLRSYVRHLPHWRVPGSVYFVTWRLHPRQQLLSADERSVVVEVVRHFAGERFELYAYVVMDDHVHVIARPTADHALESIVYSWKSYTAYRLQREHGRTGALWQDEYFDRIVRDEDEFWEKCQYILNNPRKRWPESGRYAWVWVFTGDGHGDPSHHDPGSPDRPSYAVSRLDYELPPELIAQQPLRGRTESRLLHIEVVSGAITDRRFTELPELLPPDTLIVLNDSRVVPARVYGRRPVGELGQGGGRVEVLFHRWLGGGVCEAVVGSGAGQPAGERVLLPGGWRCELLEPKALDGLRVRYLDAAGEPASFEALTRYLEEHGLPPTPPYIKRSADSPDTAARLAEDHQRYQTVYAERDGSVAAPTAGLHFDEAMLGVLGERGHSLRRVTLHVGLGTFAPVRVDDLAQHDMHEEAYSVEAQFTEEYSRRRANGEPVLAVGTTSLRVLHTLAGSEGAATTGMTRAFIYPGRGTSACELLLTNFHLPRSTLLALVYAFGGEQLLRRAYRHAIAERYRFYSYGDCMLIDRRAPLQ